MHMMESLEILWELNTPQENFLDGFHCAWDVSYLVCTRSDHHCGACATARIPRWWKRNHCRSNIFHENFEFLQHISLLFNN